MDDPVSSVDFLPWICRLAGASHGADLSPLLRGEGVRERPIFWHYPHYSDQGGKPSGAVRAAMPMTNPEFDPARSSEQLTGYEVPIPPV